MKYLSIFFALMFMAFAALQVNDPDPVLWILIYGVMAVISVMAIFEFFNRKLLIGLAVLFVVYLVILFPGVAEWFRQEDKSVLFDDVMKMEYPYIEESREFIGLLICLVILTVYLFRSFRHKTA
ncbi:MAG TPA: transmembrane 220 family protein [Cyclobacteriaceae bacterium]|nr:transmembrane 220 family protein [Cyclobacteriaceae bacterium]